MLRNYLDWRCICANICAKELLRVQYETSSTKIKARLLAEGWELVGGTKHDKFRKPGHSAIMVPRHRTVTPGVAQSIAKAAGWAR